MSQVIPVHNPLRDTKLWKRLNEGFKETANEPISEIMAPNLLQICDEASTRMKGMAFFHPQYTLHDEKHLLRVVEIMSKIIPEDVLDIMNSIEISLLILSAYFHDQGMILEGEEYDKLNSDSKFIIFKEDWEIEHPNLREAQQRQLMETLIEKEKERCIQIEQELRQMMLSDYLRETHSQRSYAFLEKYKNDKRWEISGVNISSIVAKLCYSHCQPISDLTSANNYFFDESVGQKSVNVPYLALVLRLADILDLDRDRTPDTLFKTIHFTNDISIREWEKHRSVDGWEISSNRIRFTMRCEQPIYEKAAREFMDAIDVELNNAKNLLESFPNEFNKYDLKLPIKVDRSRISAKDNAYEYYDLEFSLSRDEIVKLLMTDNLYYSPSLCVRELLQNSLDALRYRKALIKRDLMLEWNQGIVEFVHFLNEDGHEVLRCTDNGIGMDINVIERFLTKVGRSYYRSPEFNQERASLARADCDFDPCSQFGIGFMSCFMLGDKINIRTRRDYGPNKAKGKPLLIEINGLGGMVVIRHGSEDQELGTAVEILGRKKPKFFNIYIDKVKLLDVIKSYALMCEFPIKASCMINEIRGEIQIKPNHSIPHTGLEKAKVKKCETFSQDFSDFDSQLGGQVRTSILIDEIGRFSIANEEAIWELNEFQMPILHVTGSGTIISGEQDQLCLDGILVCGSSWGDKKIRLSIITNNHISLGRDYYILDVRGNLKPPLTPARLPPYSSDREPRWERLNDIARKAHGKLWEKIVQRIGRDVDDLNFWKLAVIHRAPIKYLRKQVIWDNLSIPIMKRKISNEPEWQKISSLSTVLAESSNKREPIILTLDGDKITHPDDVTKWEYPSRLEGFSYAEKQLYPAILGFCEMDQENGTIKLDLKKPTSPEGIPFDNMFSSLFLLPYSSRLTEYISVQFPFENANLNHPLVKLAYDSRYKEDLSDIELFSRYMIKSFGDSEFWNELENNECTKSEGTILRLKYLGNLASNLSSYSNSLQPPYIVLLKNKKIIQIKQDDFERWAKLDS